VQDFFGLAVFLVISVVSWLFVLSKSTRRNHSKPAWDFFRMGKEQRAIFDSANLAVSLILALVFTTLFVTFLVGTIIRYFR